MNNSVDKAALFAKECQLSLGGIISNVELETTHRGGLPVLRLYLGEASDVSIALDYLKNNHNTRFQALIDIIGVDRMGMGGIDSSVDKRFEVVYLLLSTEKNLRVTLVAPVDEMEAVDSAVPFYSGAAWSEREIWDMFGINFVGHPDMRRILTDYAFEGHPLRKDFPVSGFVESRYDDTKKRVVLEAVELSQSMRNFEFSNPWDGDWSDQRLSAGGNPEQTESKN